MYEITVIWVWTKYKKMFFKSDKGDWNEYGREDLRCFYGDNSGWFSWQNRWTVYPSWHNDWIIDRVHKLLPEPSSRYPCNIQIILTPFIRSIYKSHYNNLFTDDVYLSLLNPQFLNEIEHLKAIGVVLSVIKSFSWYLE